MQESSFLRWCLDLPAALFWAPSAQSSTWMLSSSTPVSPDVGLASSDPLCLQCTDFHQPLLQVNWASLPTTRGGSGPGGSAFCCAVPYSSARPSSCSASPTRCRQRTRRRGRTASTLCFLLLSVQTTRRRAPATGSSIATSQPTAPPAVSSSEVSAAVFVQ